MYPNLFSYVLVPHKQLTRYCNLPARDYYPEQFARPTHLFVDLITFENRYYTCNEHASIWLERARIHSHNIENFPFVRPQQHTISVASGNSILDPTEQ
jgi:hypothetical protein